MKRNRRAFLKRQKELDELIQSMKDKMTKEQDAKEQKAAPDSPEVLKII